MDPSVEERCLAEGRGGLVADSLGISGLKASDFERALPEVLFEERDSSESNAEVRLLLALLHVARRALSESWNDSVI